MPGPLPRHLRIAPAAPLPACPSQRVRRCGDGRPEGLAASLLLPAAGSLSGPRAGAAALSPCRARGQRWGAGGTAGRGRWGLAAPQGHAVRGAEATPPAGAGAAGQDTAEVWLRRQPISGFLPAAVTGEPRGSSAAGQGRAGHGGSLQR